MFSQIPCMLWFAMFNNDFDADNSSTSQIDFETSRQEYSIIRVYCVTNASPIKGDARVMFGKSIYLVTYYTRTQHGLNMERTWTHLLSLVKHVRIIRESSPMYSRIVFDRCPYQEWIK